jgi:enoyl-CoA hydratase/carnithine racemase
MDEAQTLARRVAEVPAASIAAVKRVVDTSLGTLDPALTAESRELAALLRSGTHRQPMQAFLDAGGQTRDSETTDFAALVEGMLSALRDDGPSEPS